MSHRHLTDPTLSSAHHLGHSSQNPAALLAEYGPRRPTDPSELRQLVLDYLCHQCFVDTASAFARESAAHVPEPVPERPVPAEPAPLRDTVVERTVRFDTDDDGDAEMGDLTASTHDGLPPSAPPSAAAPDPSNAGAPSPVPNGAADADQPSERAPDSYPDWTAQDVYTTRVRLAIKEHIVTGRVKEAIKLIESHFPAVLGPSLMTKGTGASSAGTSTVGGTGLKTGKSQRLKPGRVAFTTRPLSGPLPPGSPSGAAKSSHSQPGSSGAAQPSLRQSMFKRAEPATQTAAHSATTSSGGVGGGGTHQFPHAIFGSLNPAHIALNLQIQFFVEFVRSISQTHGPGANGAEPEGEGQGGMGWEGGGGRVGKGTEHGVRKGAGHGQGELAGSVGGLSDDTSTTSSSVSTRTTSLALSLPHCRALHDFVHQLPEPLERAVFAKELENVAGLLAYVDPWESPVRKYLDQSRRDVLAERVNAAILVHLGRSPTSILQLVAQQTWFTWATLNELGEKVPCPSLDDKARTKPCNIFNLTEFVNLQELGGNSSGSGNERGNLGGGVVTGESS